MTTKPKAKKFRIRRSTPSASAAPKPGEAAGGVTDAPEDAVRKVVSDQPGSGAASPSRERQSATRAGAVDSAKQTASETDIDAIRREGLTGRQLRLARRVAQRNGIAATSDFDAVRQLRTRGIDPFKQANLLELVVPGASAGGTEERTVKTSQLPQTVPTPQENLPATDNPAERRAAEIRKVQQDIARRRRRRQVLLLTRLSFFVFLPTLLTAWYFYAVATPMYATKSAFFILKAEDSGGVGGFFSGTQFATNQDAFAVQDYLLSKDAMLRLDSDEGFKAHFQQDKIDAIQRLDDQASIEEAYRMYKRNIVIGFDPTEGVIRMEVIAADPQISTRFSEALISYAEDRVDELTLRKRDSTVNDAEEALTSATIERQNAQEKLVRLQQEGSVIDPEGRIGTLRGQINTVEVQIQEKRLELQAQLDNRRPNAAKVEGLQGDIRRLEGLLSELNGEMKSASSGEDSLAELSVQIQLAQADLATRDLMLQSALERLEQARRDADTQARYLTTSVKPVPPEDASYPRKFENTILAFLIFSGIYLIMSITASILREQVTA